MVGMAFENFNPYSVLRVHGIQVMPQFAFDEAEAVSNCTKARTTIMIKNIPNKYK